MRWEFGSAGAGASWRALGLKTAGAHSTRSLKISGCKRRCPKDLRVHAPAAPALTHSLLYPNMTLKLPIYYLSTSKQSYITHFSNITSSVVVLPFSESISKWFEKFAHFIFVKLPVAIRVPLRISNFRAKSA